MNGQLVTFVCRLVSIGLTALWLIPSARSEAGVDAETVTYITEMLVSDRREDNAEGEREVAKRGGSVEAWLLDHIKTGDISAKGRYGYFLGIVISPWIRGKEAGKRFHEFTSFATPRRPVDRSFHLEGAAEIRKVLQEAVVALLNESENEVPSFIITDAIGALCETLGEVADDQTMDWALWQLQTVKSLERAGPLVKLAESYLGIPHLYRRRGICGNSTQAEIDEFRISENLNFAKTRIDLRVLWRKVRPLGAKGRIAFAIKSWRDHFIPKQAISSGYYRHNGWLFEEMEPIVRFGGPAVDQLRMQQSMEKELEAKGVWEAVIAAITGQEDPRLVAALFGGDDCHRELACEVVVAAATKKWLRELEELQGRGGFDSGIASEAIASCHRQEGVPALERALAKNPDNSHADYAVKELNARVELGPPKGMRLYDFPSRDFSSRTAAD